MAKMSRKTRDGSLRALIWLCAIVTVSILTILVGYILINGLKGISWKFLTDYYMESDESHRGILPMIINTLYLVILTLLLATPIGIGSAVFLTQYAKQGRLVRAIRFTTEVLAGIPSIIYGLFGFAFFVAFLRLSYSLLAGALTMTIIILPTIVRTTEEAMIAVPQQYKEGALALGADRLRVILQIIIPTAMPGILTSIILAMGRIVGESAALMFTAGLVTNMPTGILSHIFTSGRTLTLHLYTLAMRGEPLEQSYATAAVLLIIVFLLNRLAGLIGRALKKG